MRRRLTPIDASWTSLPPSIDWSVSSNWSILVTVNILQYFCNDQSKLCNRLISPETSLGRSCGPGVPRGRPSLQRLSPRAAHAGSPYSNTPLERAVLQVKDTVLWRGRRPRWLSNLVCCWGRQEQRTTPWLVCSSYTMETQWDPCTPQLCGRVVAHTAGNAR